WRHTIRRQVGRAAGRGVGWAGQTYCSSRHGNHYRSGRWTAAAGNHRADFASQTLRGNGPSGEDRHPRRAGYCPIRSVKGASMMAGFWDMQFKDLVNLAILIATIMAIYYGPIKAVKISRDNARVDGKRDRQLSVFHSLIKTRKFQLSPEHVTALN